MIEDKIIKIFNELLRFSKVHEEVASHQRQYDA